MAQPGLGGCGGSGAMDTGTRSPGPGTGAAGKLSRTTRLRTSPALTWFNWNFDLKLFYLGGKIKGGLLFLHLCSNCSATEMNLEEEG